MGKKCDFLNKSILISPDLPGTHCSSFEDTPKFISFFSSLDNVYPMPLGSSPAAAAVVSAMGTSAATLGSVASAAINAAGYGSGGPVNGVLARRCGITPGSPLGVGWETIIGVSSNFLSEFI